MKSSRFYTFRIHTEFFEDGDTSMYAQVRCKFLPFWWNNLDRDGEICSYFGHCYSEENAIERIEKFKKNLSHNYVVKVTNRYV